MEIQIQATGNNSNASTMWCNQNLLQIERINREK